MSFQTTMCKLDRQMRHALKASSASTTQQRPIKASASTTRTASRPAKAQRPADARTEQQRELDRKMGLEGPRPMASTAYRLELGETSQPQRSKPRATRAQQFEATYLSPQALDMDRAMGLVNMDSNRVHNTTYRMTLGGAVDPLRERPRRPTELDDDFDDADTREQRERAQRRPFEQFVDPQRPNAAFEQFTRSHSNEAKIKHTATRLILG